MGLVMTELDRRAIVTGLAAVAAAGVAPALAEITPPPAFIRTRFHSQWRPVRFPQMWDAAYRVTLLSRWHVDIRGDHDATYRHHKPDFVFAVYPERPGVVWLMRPADQPIYPIREWGSMSVLATGLAYALHNSFAPASLRPERNGSFIIENASPDYYAPVIADAPALPRIERFADGVADGLV